MTFIRVFFFLSAFILIYGGTKLPYLYADVGNIEDVSGEQTALNEALLRQKSIANSKNTIDGLVHIHLLERLRPYLPVDWYGETMWGLAGKVEDPMVRFDALRSGARALLNMDNAMLPRDEIVREVEQQGCLVNWQFVGPFDNPSMQGFDDVLAPEMGMAGPYEGKNRPIDWRAIPPKMAQLCTFYLNAIAQPSSAAVAYLSTQIRSEKAQDIMLMMGSYSAYKVWVNGQLVGTRRDSFGLGIDNDAWRVSLRKGANNIVIKLGSNSEGGLSFIARVVDLGGHPLPGISAQAHWPSHRLEQPEHIVDPASYGVLEKIYSTLNDIGASSLDKLLAAWLWKQRQSLDPGTPWRDVGEQLLMLERDQLSAESWVLVSELYEEFWRQQQILSRVEEGSDDNEIMSGSGAIGFAQWHRATNYQSARTRQEQLIQKEILDRLAQRYPDYLPIQLARVDWYSNNGMAALALEWMKAYQLDNSLSVPAYLQRLINLNERVGQRSQVDDYRRRLRAISRLSGAYIWHEARLLATQGDVDSALQLVNDQRHRTPWSFQWSIREAELLRSADRLEQAVDILKTLIEMAPGNARYHEILAHYLVAADDHDGAIESIENAQSLRPNEQRYTQLMSVLKPDSERYYEQWMRTDIRELAQQTEAETYNYDTLIDQSMVRVASDGLSQRAVQRVHRVIRPDGIDIARMESIPYRMDDEQVEILRVRVYKPDGRTSDDYRQWRTGSARKRSTTYNDTAFVNVQATNVEQGDLIEFRYIIREIANANFRGDYFGDIQYLQSHRPIAFQRYVAMYPGDWELFFRAPSLPHERTDRVVEQTNKSRTSYNITSFEMTNVPRVYTESSQPGTAEVYDYLLVSNKETYDEIGRWWWNLVEKQLVVDDDMRAIVKALTEDLQSDEDKVRAIYNYVVRNTRYLHVGLGIHGWKPYRTTTVFRNRYGDCKDKTALLKVMLELAGVPTELALVRTRQLGVVDSYPASMHIFNHAIAYVPSLDLFLDATAEFNGSYELTAMNHGAIAVVIQDGGEAQWLNLPIASAQDNSIQYELNVDLSRDVPLTRGKIKAFGANAVGYRQSLQDPERRQDRFEQQIAHIFTGASLKDATYNNLDNLDAPTVIEFSFEDGSILRRAQQRRYFYPFGAPQNLLDTYAKSATRRQPLTIRVPYEQTAQINFQLPAGYTIDVLPADTLLHSDFGQAVISYQLKDTELAVAINYSIDVQRIEIEEYPQFRQFISSLDAALNTMLTLSPL